MVRGKLLSLREEDFVMAARLDGESETQIITRYMLPGFTSYIIVSLTASIPNMILGETSLSFLGVGLRPPTISWGDAPGSPKPADGRTNPLAALAVPLSSWQC